MKMWSSKASKFDIVYRKLLLTKLFTKGWGSPDTLRRIFELGKILSDRTICQELVDDKYPIHIDKEEEQKTCRIVHGHFYSPFANFLPDLMPEEVQTAKFQLVLPLLWPKRGKPVCIHLAGTGDHHFWRRRTLMAKPLIKEYGIGSLLLENPFYGDRKPKDQLRSSLNNVSDLFVMGGALILESLVLLHWLEKQGYGPLGLTGVSMGGHMATLAATNWHKPIPLIPCLSWSSATPAFTDGVLSGAIPWNVLATQYDCHTEYQADILRNMLKCPQSDAFSLGKEFAINYPESSEDLTKVHIRTGLARLHRERSTKQAEGLGSPSQGSNLEKPHKQYVHTSYTKQTDKSMCNETSGSDPIQIRGNANSTEPIATKQTTNCLQSALEQSRSGHQTQKEASHLNTADVGIVQPISSHLLTVSHGTTPDKNVWNENSTLRFTKNHRVEVSADQCNLHQNTNSFESKLDGEFLKETANIPVMDNNFSNSSKSASNVEKQQIKEDLPPIPDQDSKSKDTDTKIQKRYQKFKRSSSDNGKNGEFVNLKDEAMEFMHGVMDASTYVGNFSVPVDPGLIIVITAKKDGYILRDNVPSIKDLWPGVEVRYLNSGHVRAILFNQNSFRRAINDAFTRYMIKYPDEY